MFTLEQVIEVKRDGSHESDNSSESVTSPILVVDDNSINMTQIITIL